MHPRNIEGTIVCVIMVSCSKKEWQHHFCNLNMEVKTIFMKSTADQENRIDDKVNPSFCRTTLLKKS